MAQVQIIATLYSVIREFRITEKGLKCDVLSRVQIVQEALALIVQRSVVQLMKNLEG